MRIHNYIQKVFEKSKVLKCWVSWEVEKRIQEYHFLIVFVITYSSDFYEIEKKQFSDETVFDRNFIFYKKIFRKKVSPEDCFFFFIEGT